MSWGPISFEDINKNTEDINNTNNNSCQWPSMCQDFIHFVSVTLLNRLGKSMRWVPLSPLHQRLTSPRPNAAVLHRDHTAGVLQSPTNLITTLVFLQHHASSHLGISMLRVWMSVLKWPSKRCVSTAKDAQSLPNFLTNALRKILLSLECSLKACSPVLSYLSKGPHHISGNSPDLTNM